MDWLDSPLISAYGYLACCVAYIIIGGYMGGIIAMVCIPIAVMLFMIAHTHFLSWGSHE